MKDRVLVAHALAALLALMLALLAWLFPGQRGADRSAVMIAALPRQVTQLHWQEYTSEAAPTSTVKVSPSQQEVSVQLGQSPFKTYPTSEVLEEFMSALVPLKAARRLGTPQLAPEMGLDSPFGVLTLEFGERKRAVRVGARRYGSSERYAQLYDGALYLLDENHLRPLRHGGQDLVDRRLVGLATAQIRRATIKTGGRTWQFIQRYFETPAKAFFANPADPNQRLDAVSQWLDRVVKLRIADVGAQQPTGEPILVMRFEGERSAKQQDYEIRVWAPQDAVALATSSRFTTPVVLPSAAIAVVLEDLALVTAPGL